MKPQKLFLAIVACFLFHTILPAQDKLPIKFGKITPADFETGAGLIDSSTNAVIIAHTGRSEYFANVNDFTFSLMYKEKKRVKLLRKNAFELATVIIRLYSEDNSKPETLEDLKASTYNLENGQVIQTKLDKSSVYTEKVSKNWLYKKFTFPALKEGSIIEYEYEIKSDYAFNLQPWVFQGLYPVLWSQYEASIPEFFHFIFSSQGYQPFFLDTTVRGRVMYDFLERLDRAESQVAEFKSSGFQAHRLEGFIDDHKWIMKNVPALKEEPYTTTLRNAVSKISFQLQEIVYPKTLPKPYMNTWEQAYVDLMRDDYFGLPITRANNWLDNEMPAIVKSDALPIDKARSIFEFLRDHFTCTSHNNNRTTAVNLKEIFNNKSGDVSDINMLMVAMLRNQHIASDPVLVSTRSHGITSTIYPLVEEYNYILARANINGSYTYFDASVPRLGFNKLPLDIYNGHAWVVNAMGEAVNFEADSLVEKNSKLVTIVNTDKGPRGSFINNLGYYRSLETRDQLAKTSPADFKKQLEANFLKDEMTIENINIDSVKQLDEPVTVSYDMQLKNFAGHDIVYFNPMLGQALAKNPFAAAERFYPVEMPYTFDDTYVLSMQVPTGYVVDEIPKSVRLVFNENQGMFEYLVSASKNTIQLRCHLRLSKTKFLNEDYQSLRDFYTYIVKKESEHIVFKKSL